VRLVGRLVGVRGRKVVFSGSLKNQCAMSDLKMNRLLDRIDEWSAANGFDGVVDPPHRFEPTRVEASPPLEADLDGVTTVLWATGFRPDYSWLDLDVLDRKGRLRHEGGVVDAPGVYVVGLPFLRRRKSSLIDGAGADARALSAHLEAYLAGRLQNGTPKDSGTSRAA
jgi:putative flavoprotein involved in K+ transport